MYRMGNVIMSCLKQQVVAGNGEFVVRDVDATEVVCWIEGVCYFSEASLENIMDKLARWYDVEVFFASESAKMPIFRWRLNAMII